MVAACYHYTIYIRQSHLLNHWQGIKVQCMTCLTCTVLMVKSRQLDVLDLLPKPYRFHFGAPMCIHTVHRQATYPSQNTLQCYKNLIQDSFLEIHGNICIVCRCLLIQFVHEMCIIVLVRFSIYQSSLMNIYEYVCIK